ncbi:MAG: hypothetical protein KY475_01650 [Planctomycetes bacterium]|nr:hypothetical protein [Planctomycetota bacterium]
MNCRLGAIAAWVLLAASAASGDDRSPASPDGVLVLRNGHVIRGQITRLGDRYLVAFGESGEVRLPADEVEFQCRDLEEAYARKQALLDPRNLRQRLELGEWCLRHELHHRAADQLLAALSINPFDPRALALRRRLLHAAEADRIAAESPAEAGSGVDWSKVEQALEDMPAPAVEMFASVVQPLLLNRCGTNACHGSQANREFRLLRPLTDGQTLPRRLTQRNLYAALQMLNSAEPDRSPLLTVPRGPHGGEPAGLFDGRRERQWEQLREWARLAASRGEPGRQQIGSLPDERPAAATAPLSVVRQHEIHRSVFTGHPESREPGAIGPARDPFDPDIFNRRYFPDNKPPATANLPAEPAAK